MCSKPKNLHKSTSSPNSGIIPNSFDIKNMPNLTAPPESFQNLQIKFKDHKNIFLKLAKCDSTLGN